MLRLRAVTGRRFLPALVVAVALALPACGGDEPQRSTGPARLGIEGDWRGTLRQSGLRFTPSMSTWSAQAELLAGGDETGFRALTQELTAGRRAR